MRRIDPDMEESDVEAERLTRIIIAMQNKIGYSEGSGNERLLKWLLGVATAALLAAFANLWNTSVSLASVVATQTAQQHQLDRIEERLPKPVYRGADDK